MRRGRRSFGESTAPPSPGGAPPVHGHGLLQGHDDRVGRQRSDRHCGRAIQTCCRWARSSRSDRLGERYNGVYTVMDTGPKVHGRHVDIYMWNCNEALELGRRSIQITVLRLGWNPRASSPRLVDRLFRQREANLPPPPPWPPTEAVAATQK